LRGHDPVATLAPRTLLGKLEAMNPGGSVRTPHLPRLMIERAEKKTANC